MGLNAALCDYFILQVGEMLKKLFMVVCLAAFVGSMTACGGGTDSATIKKGEGAIKKTAEEKAAMEENRLENTGSEMR